MDTRAYNRTAWDRQVRDGNRWTVPVSPDAIAAARHGTWTVYLTPTRPVPSDWFPPLRGTDVLGLACGGGQQGPTFAAAGAHVTIVDNSPAQLAQDRAVAERERLPLTTIEGDMRDLAMLPDQSFDLVFHPVSNVFVPEVLSVWREAFRVLRPGGVLLAGFMNPAVYVFDSEHVGRGELRVRFPLPYADVDHLTPDELAERVAAGAPLEWSHSLTDQLGGQLAAGLRLTHLYEDIDPDTILGHYMPSYIATRALRP